MTRSPKPAAGPAEPDLEQRRRLLVASTGAAAVALVILLVAILPAEYGMDPTGLGEALGLTRLAEAAPPAPAPNTSVEFRYEAVWILEAGAQATTDGYAKHGTTRSIGLAVQVANVAKVHATLTWDDANQTAGQRTEPDIFEVRILPPRGSPGEPVLARNDATGAGQLRAAYVWREPPPARPIRAADSGAAVAAARLAEPDDPSASGSWTINVTLVHAGGAQVGGVPVSGSAADDGNTWRLHLLVETYRLDEERLSASPIREDTARILVKAGQGLEYKLRLKEASRLEYRWSANTSVFYDFHGERDGDTSGAFTSHKSGTARRDEGQLVAPFAGTHGWYWENRSNQDVTVEVTTSGVYEVVTSPADG